MIPEKDNMCPICSGHHGKRAMPIAAALYKETILDEHKIKWPTSDQLINCPMFSFDRGAEAISSIFEVNC